MIKLSKTCNRSLLAPALAGASLGLLFACGGGNEVVPPVPVVEGPGMATVTLGGVELGQTPLVTAVIAEAAQAKIPVTGEATRFEGDPPVAELSRRDLAPDDPPCEFVVEDSAAPGTLYVAGDHFTLDFTNGRLTANADPDLMGVYLIPDGTDVTVNYCFLEPIYTVSVGVTLPVGDDIVMKFYNLPGGPSGMWNTNVVADSSPADGSFAFTIGAITDLTVLNSTDYTLQDDPAQNDATLIAVDLTNLLNPCVEGRVVGLMEEEMTRDEVLLEVNFDDPVCP